MKTIVQIIILTLFLIKTRPIEAQTYCTAKGTFPWEQWLEQVSISNGHGFLSYPKTAKDGYGNFTSQTPASVYRGEGNLVTIVPRSSWDKDPRNDNMFWRTWIDFNQDGDFNDTDELVVSAHVTHYIDVFLDNERAFVCPTTARVGYTRMRVAMKVGASPEPCETFERGEVEDYTINIKDTTPSVGKDTLRLVAVSGDTLARQGGNVTLNITIKNTGTASSDPLTPLSIFQEQEPFAFKGPQPGCYSKVSTSVTIGRGIQPNETVTLPFTFKMSDDFTHISPYVPNIRYGPTNVTIGNRGNSYCSYVFITGGVIDTLAYRYGIKAILDISDLSSEIMTADSTYGEDGVFNFTVKITNRGSVKVKNVITDINYGYSFPNKVTVTPQRGTFEQIFFFGSYYNLWVINELAAGESLTAQVSVRDSIASLISSFCAQAFCTSNQFVDYNTSNNGACQVFRRRPVVLPDLSIVALPTSFTEANAGNLTDYPFGTALRLKYKYTIANTKPSQAENILYYDVYISEDSLLSDDDFRRFRFGGPMGTNREAEQEVFVIPPSNTLPNGKYYVFIKIDGTEAFAESDETNNVSRPIPFDFYAMRCYNAAKVPWSDWISNIKFNTIDNTSDKILFNKNNQFTAGYSAFATAMSTAVQRGQSYPFTITSSASWSGRLPNHYYAAWVDFNGDGDFDDAGEKVYQGRGQNGMAIGSLYIPSTTTLGKTIIRFAVRNGGYPETCSAYEEGEVEDYFLEITEGSVTYADLAISLSATPSVYTKFNFLNYIITVKNTGNQAFTNVNVEFKFPAGTTNGGTATPSVGTWHEWCAGGIQCFKWTIPVLNINQTATLSIPVFVLNTNNPIVATATLLSSSPTDINTANNQSTVTVNPVAMPATQNLSQFALTDNVPVYVQSVAPSITEGPVTVQLQSTVEQTLSFEFYNNLGILIKKENRLITKGDNALIFDTQALPSGIYVVVPVTTPIARATPLKFVKM